MSQPGQRCLIKGRDESTGSTMFDYKKWGEGMSQPGQRCLTKNYIEMGGGDESTGSTMFD